MTDGIQARRVRVTAAVAAALAVAAVALTSEPAPIPGPSGAAAATPSSSAPVPAVSVAPVVPDDSAHIRTLDIAVETPALGCLVVGDVPPTGLVRAKIGEPIAVKGWLPNYSGVPIYTVKWVKKAPGRYPYTANHGAWAVVRVDATHVGCRAFAAVYDLQFVGADGKVYPSKGTGGSDEFSFHNLVDGKRVSGLLYFDVPPTAILGGRVEVLMRGEKPYGYWPITGPLRKAVGLGR